jgi:hypothetical protein
VSGDETAVVRSTSSTSRAASSSRVTDFDGGCVELERPVTMTATRRIAPTAHAARMAGAFEGVFGLSRVAGLRVIPESGILIELAVVGTAFCCG